jgi:GDP-4-dehydro-6-deoxy-D-mannose reductase
MLEFFLARAKVPIQVQRDANRYRPVDAPRLYGNAAKLRQATGWAPSYRLEETLADVLEYWRARVSTP